LTLAGEAFIERAIAERSRWVDDLAATLNAVESQKVAEALAILTEVAKKLEVAEKV